MAHCESWISTLFIVSGDVYLVLSYERNPINLRHSQVKILKH